MESDGRIGIALAGGEFGIRIRLLRPGRLGRNVPRTAAAEALVGGRVRPADSGACVEGFLSHVLCIHDWRSSRRCSTAARIARRSSAEAASQAPISVRVRRQPAHQPIASSIWQMPMHGEGTTS